jgi:hypothetical protein
VDLDAHGRAWLEPVQLWLGVKVNPATGGDRLVLIEPVTELEIGDYTAMRQGRAAAEARAADAEERLRQVEAELRRLRGRKP